MRRRDVRSMLLSLVLGDGCLHYIRNNGKVYGGLTIDHGLQQTDYQMWKAELISRLTGREVKTRTGHKGKSIQLSVCMKRFKAWRKVLYPGGKKDVTKILKYIDNPEFAIAIWLMDDGYVEPTIFNECLQSARFRLFTCATPIEYQALIIDWFTKHFSSVPKIKIQKKAGYGDLPFLKLTEKESLIIWEKIRDFVLQFESMKYKFRHIEHIYQKRMAQRTLGQKTE